MTRRCSSVATAATTSPPSSPAVSRRINEPTGPLPWLPPVPRRLAEDDFWGRYFDRRDELIQRQGTAVRAAATSWTPQTAPAWAVPTLSDPNLTRDLATWRAARDIPDTDLRPTGPPANDRAGSRPAEAARSARRRSRRAPDTHSNRQRPGSPRRSTPASPPTRSGRPSPARSPRPTMLASTAPSCDASLPTDRSRSNSPPPRSRTASSTPSASARHRRRVQPPKPAAPRPYEPTPLPTPPPDRARTAGLAPTTRPGPRR